MAPASNVGQGDAQGQTDEVSWMKLEHPYSESSGVQVILNNQECMALRMTNLEEAIRSMGPTGPARRRSGSRASNVSDHTDSVVSSVKDDSAALELIQDGFMQMMKDQHAQWMSFAKKKVIMKKTKILKEDEAEWFEWITKKNLPSAIGPDDWMDHPLNAALSELDIETRQTLYVGLNKERKEADDKAAGKAVKSAMKAPETGEKRPRGSRRVQTLVSESQGTDREVFSDPLMPSSSPEGRPPAKKGKQSKYLDDDEEEEEEE